MFRVAVHFSWLQQWLRQLSFGWLERNVHLVHYDHMQCISTFVLKLSTPELARNRAPNVHFLPVIATKPGQGGEEPRLVAMPQYHTMNAATALRLYARLGRFH